jgi:hypothetical protein
LGQGQIEPIGLPPDYTLRAVTEKNVLDGNLVHLGTGFGNPGRVSRTPKLLEGEGRRKSLRICSFWQSPSRFDLGTAVIDSKNRIQTGFVILNAASVRL